MKNLRETIESKKPIKVFVKDAEDTKWTSLGVYEYNEEEKRYQGEIGYITIEAVTKWMLGNIDLDHLKIEVAE